MSPPTHALGIVSCRAPSDPDDALTHTGAEPRAFSLLLDLQFWLMGRDVEHPTDNLLCRLGFTREPAPDERRPSRYTRTGYDDRITVWPCGILLTTNPTNEPAASTASSAAAAHDAVTPSNADSTDAAARGLNGCLVLRGCAPALVVSDRLRDTHDPAWLHAELQRGASCPPATLIRVSRWFAHYEQTIDIIAGIGHRTSRPGLTAALAPPGPCSLAHAWLAFAEGLTAGLSG